MILELSGSTAMNILCCQYTNHTETSGFTYSVGLYNVGISFLKKLANLTLTQLKKKKKNSQVFSIR